MPFLRICILFLLFCISRTTHAQMQVLNSTSLSLCTCPGQIWNTTNITKPSILFSDTGYTKRLMFSKYGFTIPQDAFIQGIEVAFDYTTNATGNMINDKLVLPLFWGAQVGTDKADQTASYTGSNTIVLGGPSDMWGWYFTPSDINSDGFGFNIKFHSSAAGKQLAFTNGAQITVHYINPNGIKNSQKSNSGSKIGIQNKHVNFFTDTNEALEVEIFSLTGQLIRKEILEVNEPKSIDMTMYENGLYTYTLKSNTQFQKGKLYLHN